MCLCVPFRLDDKAEAASMCSAFNGKTFLQEIFELGNVYLTTFFPSYKNAKEFPYIENPGPWPYSVKSQAFYL